MAMTGRMLGRWRALVPLLPLATAGCCSESGPQGAAWPASERPALIGPGPDRDTTPAGDARGVDAEALTPQNLIAAHDAEVSRLPFLVSSGIVQVNWRDGEARHFEQGDLDLRYRAPREASLRVSKLGEVFLVAGTNDLFWWWYDGFGKPTRFQLRRHRDAKSGATGSERGAGTVAEAGSDRVEAEALLLLFGLKSLGKAAGWDPLSPTDPTERAVRIEPQPESGGVPLRALFAPSRVQGSAQWVLVGLDLLDRDDEAVASVRYDAHRRVERRGVAPGEWPVVATRLRMTIPPREGRSASEWLIELDRPVATSDRIVDRLFDPVVVRTSLRADIEESDEGAP